MTFSSPIHQLHRLSRLYGIQTSYRDMSNHLRQAPAEILLSILKELGAPVASLSDAAPAWRECYQQILRSCISPVVVAWNGGPAWVKLRIPSDISESAIRGNMTLETGENKTWSWQGADLKTTTASEYEGIRYVTKILPFPARLPSGYHRLTLEMGGKTAEALVIAAPTRAYTPPDKESRIWGAFIPLYALRTQQSWGTGDFSALAALAEFIARQGGQAIGTLPLLASFLDENFQPSPYLPVSRLFWNEFYLDIMKIPELKQCPPAREALTSSQSDIAHFNGLSLVDYRRQMRLKRRILTELCRCFYTGTSSQTSEFQNYIKTHPEVERYARFRATCEKRRDSWYSWPVTLRNGTIREGDYEEEAKRYHLYVQWLAHEQMQDVVRTAQEKGVRLYLDLPLGAHPDGFDVWREQDIFATGFSVGAPPDNFFTLGQNWGFPPIHPVKIRQQGYRYVIGYLRHHFRHAGIIRIDHVMGLHRLFWIARGAGPSQGVYVRNRADELYAILSLESWRQKVIIVGEDLGTVPPQVRPDMARHGLNRMYVLNFELGTNPGSAINPIFPNSVASINTHDIPPFAAFWQGLDINSRFDMGFLDEASVRSEQQSRQEVKSAVIAFLKKKGWLSQSSAGDTKSVMKACLAFLSVSDAWMVLLNLEDLWGEEKPQNIPGTTDEYANWQRKAKYSLEELGKMPQVVEILQRVNHLRRKERLI